MPSHLRHAPPSLSLSLLLSLSTVACTSNDSAFPEDGVVVPEGKADDFFSTAAAEFIIEGRSFVTVEEGEGLERAKELIRLKHVSISWFLNDFLIEEEDTTTGEVFGFGAMVKSGDFTDLDIRQLNARSFEFTFEQIVTGTKDLPELLGVDGSGAFAIEIGKPTNEEMAKLDVNEEWYRKAPWSPWKPDTTRPRRRSSFSSRFAPRSQHQTHGGTSNASSKTMSSPSTFTTAGTSTTITTSRTRRRSTAGWFAKKALSLQSLTSPNTNGPAVRCVEPSAPTAAMSRCAFDSFGAVLEPAPTRTPTPVADCSKTTSVAH